MRRVLGVSWPKIMKNEKVDKYDEPATNIIQRRRWQMLGHILRMNDAVSAKQYTIRSLKNQNQNRKRGRPVTSLTSTITSDLNKINSIEQAITIACDRQKWREIFRLQEDVARPRPSRLRRPGASI